MKYKAVLFDMDGTVLDTIQDLTNACNHALSHFGMPERTSAECAAFLGNGAKVLITKAVPEGTDDATRDAVLEYYQPWYNDHCRILTAPFAGITDLMAELKALGIRQAVISNKGNDAVQQLAAEHFPGLLELAVGESATVRRKPNPDAVLAAMESLGVDRSEVIYVGDTEVDLKTAQNAGTDCALVSWGFRSREQLEALGDYHIFDTVDELKSYLTK